MSSIRARAPSFSKSDDLSSSQMGRSSPSLEERMEELRVKNLQFAADNTRLKAHITELESSLQHHDTSTAALELKIQQLQLEKKRLEQSLQDLSTRDASQKIEPLEKEEPERAYSPKRKDPKAKELQLQLEEKQRELDESHQELDELTQQLLALQQALRGLDTYVDAKLEEERAQAQRQKALEIEHQSELLRLKRTISDLEDQLHQPQHRSTTSTLNLSHHHKPAQAESLESEFRASGEFDKMKQTIESLELQLQDLDAKLKAAHQELSAKKTDTAAQSTFLSQQQRIVELEMGNRSHQEEIAKLQAALKEKEAATQGLKRGHQASLSKLAKEIESLKDQLKDFTELQAKHQSLEQALHKKEAEIADLKSQIDKNKENEAYVSLLKTQLREKTTEITSIQKELAATKAQLSQNIEKIASLEQLLKELETLRNTLSAKEAQITALQSQMTRLEQAQTARIADQKKLTEQLQAKERELLSHQQQSSLAAAQNATLSKEIERLRASIREKEQSIRDYQAEISKLSSANSKLQLDLKQLVASRESQEKRISELEQELLDLRATLESERRENQRLKGIDQSDRLRAELDQREASLQASERTNGELREENTRLREQIHAIRTSLELGETDETSETDKIKSLLEELNKAPEPFYIKIKNGIIAMLSMLIGIIVFPFKFIGRSVGLIKNKSTLE